MKKSDLAEVIYKPIADMITKLTEHKTDAAKWLESLEDRPCVRCGKKTIFDICNECQRREDDDNG